MIMDEQWRRIDGFPDYEVSDRGRVRSHRRGAARVLAARPKSAAPTRRTNLPYLTVALYGDAGRRDRDVAPLVLEAFVGARPEGMEVRHLNSNPQDNRLSNLAWGTKQENTDDKNVRRDKCRQGHLLGGWTKNGSRRVRRCNECAREAYHAKKK